MNQLLPPPELAPTPRRDLTQEQSVLAWFELMELAERFWLANLQRQLGPGESLQDAVRRMYARWMDEHDRKLVEMARRLGRTHGR
jgi:hypothetical protein